MIKDIIIKQREIVKSISKDYVNPVIVSVPVDEEQTYLKKINIQGYVSKEDLMMILEHFEDLF